MDKQTWQKFFDLHKDEPIKVSSWVDRTVPIEVLYDAFKSRLLDELCETGEGLAMPNIQVVEGLPEGAYMMVGTPRQDGSIQVAVADPDKGVALAIVRGGSVVDVQWVKSEDGA